MFSSIIGAIRKAATDALPSGEYGTVLYDDLDMTKAKIQARVRFAEIQTEFGDPIAVSLGRRARYRQVGLLQILLHEPRGDGDGVQIEFGSQITTAIHNLVLTGTGYRIKFLSASIANGSSEGSHFVRVVRSNFSTDFYPHLLET